MLRVFFVFFEEKMFDGVPPSCVEQLIKVVCFIRSAFLLICVFASAAWENFLSVQVKNEMHIFAKFLFSYFFELLHLKKLATF